MSIYKSSKALGLVYLMNKNFLTALERDKENNEDDSLFYSIPRFVYHLDENFRSNLTRLYSENISMNAVVLDLMSSWVSHLPYHIKYKSVIGHGLNRIELERNKRLDSYWIQDLNLDRKLPLHDSSINVCLMAAAWQYLQYPEEVAAEIYRVVSPGGQLIVSFSNRAFWSKTPYIWRNTSDSQHINYIKNTLLSRGWSKIEVISKVNGTRGIRSLLSKKSDPFFSVIASKN